MKFVVVAQHIKDQIIVERIVEHFHDADGAIMFADGLNQMSRTRRGTEVAFVKYGEATPVPEGAF